MKKNLLEPNINYYNCDKVLWEHKGKLLNSVKKNKRLPRRDNI